MDPHTRHILPHSEINFGLCLAVFAGSEGKYLFHRIGRKGRNMATMSHVAEGWRYGIRHTYYSAHGT